MTANKSRAAGLWLGLLVCITYLPFLGQPFHIDDRIYLEVAGQIQREPLFPYDYPPLFEGLISADAASHSRLPLTSYYLAAVQALTGSSSEWIFHLAFLIFPLLAVWGFYDLCTFFTKYPGWLAALFACSPAFLVLSHTLMTDVPLLALWLVAVSRFWRIRHGKGGRTDAWVLLASVLTAAFVSLLTLGLLGLMAVALLLGPRPERKLSAAFWVALFVVPLVLWGFWYLKAYWHYDRFVLINTALHVAKRNSFQLDVMLTKLVSFILNIGGVFIFPAAAWLVGLRLRRFLILLLLTAAATAYLAWWGGWEPVHLALFAIFFLSGLSLLAAALDSTWNNELPVMGLWTLGILVASLLLFYAGSVRYALPALPPLLLIWQHRLEKRIADSYLRRNTLALTVLATGVLGLALSCADYRLAAGYRGAARQLYSDYRGPETRVWFAGEWGFRFYLEQEGAKPLERIGDQLEVNDILIKPFLASPWVTLYDSTEHLKLLEQRPLELDFPVRLLDFSSHAGFYSTGWGILPYSWALNDRWEWFNVFEVKKKYTGPLPEAERHW